MHIPVIGNTRKSVQVYVGDTCLQSFPVDITVNTEHAQRKRKLCVRSLACNGACDAYELSVVCCNA